MPKTNAKTIDSKIKGFPLHTQEFLKKCLEVEPSNRPSVSELMNHPYFDATFRHEFENELGPIPSLAQKKQKSKLILTPEPTSYMKIYNMKKSPKYFSPNKNSEESIRLKKPTPVSSKSNEKSYFLPDIIKKDEYFKRKKSTKQLNKGLEIKIDSKQTLKSNDVSAAHKKSRNPSLVHESSFENIVKSSFANPILSNRHQNLSKKEISPFTPEQLANISFLPTKYRLKRLENLKVTNSRSIITSLNNFSPNHK